MAKAAKKTAAKKKKAPAKKKAAPVPAKRYKATPAGSTDKEHLIGIIKANTGCTNKAAKETLDDVLGTLTASLKKNKRVQLIGFGTFDVRKRSARKGRNPQTGEQIRIKASKTVGFKAGTALKSSV